MMLLCKYRGGKVTGEVRGNVGEEEEEDSEEEVANGSRRRVLV